MRACRWVWRSRGSSRSRAILSAVAVGAVLVSAGCSRKEAEPVEPAPPGPISVSVVNRTDAVVTVFPSWDGGDPVGRHPVPGRSEASFEVAFRDRMLRFSVDLDAATVRTNLMEVRPGDRLRLTVSSSRSVVVDRIGGTTMSTTPAAPSGVSTAAR